MADPFIDLGIKTADLAAGAAGGVVNAFIQAIVFKRSSPLLIAGSVIMGSLTAAYLVEPAAKLTGTNGGATAFVLGLCSMVVCQVIAAKVGKWAGANNGTSGGPDA